MTFPSFLFEIFFYWQWTIFGTVLRVAVTRYPFFFNAKHKGNVANKLSKNTLKFFIFGKVSSNFSTTYGLITFSFFILPLYRKKSYIMPDDPALTKKKTFFWFFRAVLTNPTIFCFSWYNLLVNGMLPFRLYQNAIVSYMI